MTRAAQARRRGRPWGALAALALLFGTLGGCTEGTLAVNASKRISPTSADNAARGAYKVGDPYQINGIWYYPAEDYNYDETGVASWYGPDFHGKYTANGETYDQNDLTAAHKTLPMPSFVRVTNLDNGRSIVLRINDRGPYARGRIIDVSRRSAQLLGFEGSGTAKVRVQIMADESRQIADAMRGRGRTAVARVDPREPAPVAAPRSSVSSTPLSAPASQQAASPPPSQSAQPQPQPAASGGARPAAEPAVMTAPLPNPVGVAAPVTPRRTAIYVQAGAFSNRDNAQRLSAQLRQFGPAGVTPITVSGQQLYRVRVGPLASVEDGDRTLDAVVGAGHPEARLVVD